MIEIARGELGYTENPPGSNSTKYGRTFAWDGVPWCVIFLWWCFREAGESEAFYGGEKTASCGMLLRWYQAQGQMYAAAQAQDGDIALLNFHGGQEPEHCGLVVDREKGWYRTVEGNTSPGLEGSQDNGGCVALKRRYPSQIVAVLRPQYQPEPEVKEDITGHWAEEDIRWCMERGLMRGYPDGSFQPDEPVTRAELAAIIRRLGIS